MSLATQPPPPAAPGEVFASGSTSSRRLGWISAGLALLILAWFDWILGDWSPPLRPIAYPTAALAAAAGALILTAVFWRRPRAFQVRADGLLIAHGGRLFGDRQLIPWSSLDAFGGRRVGENAVRLVYRQQHVDRDCVLPGWERSVEEYDRLIDRLRVVLGDRFRLRLGGLEGG